MALQTFADGLADANIAHDFWWNQYHDLLTGAMTDQPVTLSYQPASDTSPTLSLKGAGHGPLIKGYKTNGTTQAFSIDSTGALTLAAGASVAASISRSDLSGAKYVVLKAWGTATAGEKIWLMNSGDTDPTSSDGLVNGDIVITIGS